MIHEITAAQHLDKRVNNYLKRGLEVKATLRLDGYYNITAKRKVSA